MNSRWLVSFLLMTACLALSPLAMGEEPGDDDFSPRAMVRSFLEASAAGRWSEAARYLPPAVQGASEPERERIARELRAVVDAYLWLDLEQLSDLPEGRRDDRLGSQAEELGKVPSPSGNGDEPVRLTRLSSGRWVFSANTVSRVGFWYAELPDRWAREHLPESLLRTGWRGFVRWQYAALALLVIVSLAIGLVARWVFKKLFARLAERSGTTFDDELLSRLNGPLTLLLATVAARVLLGQLFLARPAEAFVASTLGALRLVSVYWGLVQAVDVAVDVGKRSPFVLERPESRALLPLVSRTAKIGLTIIAGVVVLQKLGYPAGSLIAGLGIGGLAFALAAQKTVENVFGSVMLSLDQPFRPGDEVKVEDLQGIVEAVGLRSTRIRTPERTVVTIPNGRLADLRIESLAARDRIRLQAVLTLEHDTPPACVREVLAGLTELMATHPKRHPEPRPVAQLTALGTGGIDLEILAWFQTTDAIEFKAIRQEVLLSALEIVESKGAVLAKPPLVPQVPKPGAPRPPGRSGA